MAWIYGIRNQLYQKMVTIWKRSLNYYFKKTILYYDFQRKMNTVIRT